MGLARSGVIDAIEFGLTGQILGASFGKGTKRPFRLRNMGRTSIKLNFPGRGVRELKVFLQKSGNRQRSPERFRPKKTKDRPSDGDVQAALAEIADHPEITLSRREILRFILGEPTKRTEEIQPSQTR